MPAERLLIISCSLNTASRSALLCAEANTHLEAAGTPCAFLDLRHTPLPICDAGSAYAVPEVAVLKEAIAAAEGILIGTPVYNYDVNAATKNLLELTGDAWDGKTVGFACAAGGGGSYMSLMGFANSLMLDYRCVILPRFVFATGDAFEWTDEGQPRLADAEVRRRVGRLAGDLDRLSRAVAPLKLETD